jgi:hypothetical protein
LTISDAHLGANRGLCYRFDPNIDFSPRRASVGATHRESARAVPFVERAKRIARAVLELGGDASALDGLVWKEGAQFVSRTLRASVAAQPIKFKAFGSGTFGELDATMPLGQPRIVVHLELIFEQACHMFEPAAEEDSGGGGEGHDVDTTLVEARAATGRATPRRAMGTASDGTRVLEPRRLGTAPDGSRVLEPILPPESGRGASARSPAPESALVEPGDINQGELGDCFLLCALSILSIHPTLLFDMFPLVPAELVAPPPSLPVAVGSAQHAHRVVALAREELSNARLEPYEVAMIEATMARAHERTTPSAASPSLVGDARGDAPGRDAPGRVVALAREELSSARLEPHEVSMIEATMARAHEGTIPAVRGDSEGNDDVATNTAPAPSGALVKQQFCPEGVYAVRFWIASLCEWRVVLVDDYLPFDPKTSFLAFARPALHTGEIWVALVEKA